MSTVVRAREFSMGRVIVGMDPHKRSATIEIIDHSEKVLAQGRFGTDRDGYRTMLAVGRRYPDRLWAVGGCNGIGRHIAQRLVAGGESVVDVPAKLSARVRVFATGQGRKTDPVDAPQRSRGGPAHLRASPCHHRRHDSPPDEVRRMPSVPDRGGPPMPISEGRPGFGAEPRLQRQNTAPHSSPAS
jgi:hypothetical protein